jgi:hypothetical protein
MKKLSVKTGFAFIFSILILSICLTKCKKDDNPIKFPNGTFPDTVNVALADINSAYDDYNLDIHSLYGRVILLFSSNRSSSGGQFDLVQGIVSFSWDETSGVFGYGSEITSDAFLTSLTTAANTTGNDFGPYRLFSTVDGYEYLLLASENTSGNLDFYYLKNRPKTSSVLPTVLGPYPVTLLNSGSDDAYISFDTNQDTAYFSSDRGGNFDIYIKKRPADTPLSTWFESSYSASSAVDSINSTSNDKCPFAFNKIMVFASDRPGGFGGFDLYYSIFKNGKWNTAENFGPDINTSSNEYRPVIGSDQNFTNYLLMFSSDKPGGKGGFDLYFRGVTISSE